MLSPFDKARYKRLLEGLEITEVSSKKVFSQTVTLRLDPEYFWKQYLVDESVISSRASNFQSMASLGITVDASAFYPSIEPYYGQGDLPFLRVADVNSLIDYVGCTTIPDDVCKSMPTLAVAKPGDILFTKGGSIARVGILDRPAAVSRDLIFLNTSKLPRQDQIFLYLFFQTQFFKRSLIRSSSQTAQPHLTITLVRELLSLKASEQFKNTLLKAVDQTFGLFASSAGCIKTAESILLNELTLDSWIPPTPLSYVRPSSAVFDSLRLDAEYYQPRFSTLLSLIDDTGASARLGDFLLENKRGKQPSYTDEGLPVVNSKHVLRNDVRIDNDNRFASSEKGDLFIRTGDVLINGTGVGTIGRSAAYLYENSAIPDNHVTILRPGKELDPIYLSMYLNSIAGQYQVEQRLRGSSGQIELYPNDIAEFRVWLAPKKLQQSIRQQVEQSFLEKQKATLLLDAAKRAVEIAIEDSEAAALAYLRKYL